MTNLVTFLRARLDEDEATALAANADTPAGQWLAPGDGTGAWAVESRDGSIVVYDQSRPTEAEALHIARHDPARVLSEVEAKRSIIDHTTDEMTDHGLDNPRWYPDTLKPILTLLALPYTDHPDYRDEWRP